MTESEFTQLADAVFARIENAFDHGDIECNRNGSILEIEFEDGSQIIVNRHAPSQEIWLAAKSGGFHYRFQNGQWLSQRDGSELFGKLAELVGSDSGEVVRFS